MILPDNKKIYFVSDLHLVMLPDKASQQREKDFIQWLNIVKDDAAAIFLLGDMFDFWFEYKYVVPRGFVRFLGKLCELADAGIPIHFFTGNHDLWVRDYLSSEVGVVLHSGPTEFVINQYSFLIGHGNGLGPVPLSERILTRVFKNKFLRFLFSNIHPYWGIGFGKAWSKNSRTRHGLTEPFEGAGKEYLVSYSLKQLGRKHYDFLIFGHRHMAMDIRLTENSRYINTGEWIEGYTYAVFNGNNTTLHSFKGQYDFLKTSLV